MYTYAQPLMQNQQPMMQQNSMYMNQSYMDTSYNSFNTMNSYPSYNTTSVYPNNNTNYNTTNIYNNFFGQPSYMAPQMPTMMPMQQQMPSMFQGQMIGGQGMPTIMQGQSIGGFPQMPQVAPQMMPQMPMQQPSFGLDQIMGLLMSMMQMMMGGGFPGGQQVLQEEVIIGDSLAWGDPHFKFEDETGKEVTIDHKGTDGETYNVLNADGLDIDAEYKHVGGDAPQVMGAVRIDAGNQELILNKGKTTLDGEELKAGEYKLNDGRTFIVKDNGSVDISTKNGDGTINIKKDGDRYDVGTTGKVGVNTGIDNGGVLGFLATQGQNNSKDEILAEWDTSGNGILDNDDEKIVNMFRTQDDIGIYQY